MTWPELVASAEAVVLVEAWGTAEITWKVDHARPPDPVEALRSSISESQPPRTEGAEITTEGVSAVMGGRIFTAVPAAVGQDLQAAVVTAVHAACTFVPSSSLRVFPGSTLPSPVTVAETVFASTHLQLVKPLLMNENSVEQLKGPCNPAWLVVESKLISNNDPSLLKIALKITGAGGGCPLVITSTDRPVVY